MVELKWVKSRGTLVNIASVKEIKKSGRCLVFVHINDRNPTTLLFKDEKEAKEALEVLSLLLKVRKQDSVIDLDKILSEVEHEQKPA